MAAFSVSRKIRKDTEGKGAVPARSEKRGLAHKGWGR